MNHPFDALAGEYTSLLASVRVRPECQHEVDQVVARLLGFQSAGKYGEVSVTTGVPEAWMAASFEREGSSNFLCSPAQGDRWDRVSVNVPRGRGPFSNWADAAKDAYHLDGLDAIGASNWTIERACFEGELFNGFGYRDYHRMHSPYLWGATNIQQPGKYVRDGVFSSTEMDPQIGIVPIMIGMVRARPALAFANALPLISASAAPIVPASPMPSPIGVGGGDYGTKWIQEQLNAHGADPQIDEDGNYGRFTRQSVMAFQQSQGLTADGLAGPLTIAALQAA
jgi:lysozyme family protein